MQKLFILQKRKILLLILIVCVHLAVIAQQEVNISGNITASEDNTPLPGVNISVQGTTKGAITDINGHYIIQCNVGDVLSYSFMGYLTETHSVQKPDTINFALVPDIANLTEVVVLGYGKQKKSHLTGAINKVTNENLDEVPVSSVDQVLSGRVSGLTIQNTTSEVGVDARIRVRGMGSISASNEPLVVVDGYPVPDGLSMVNMNDIESIEVLKDASSTAIYGSRGANGVIIITTKSGEVAKPKYKFSAYTGIKSYIKLHPMMASDKYGVFRMNEKALAKDSDSTYFNLLNSNEKAGYMLAKYLGNTNWQEEALRVAKISNYSLSVSGGNKGMKYYLSGNYRTDQGIMKKSNYEKFSLQSKLNTTLNDRIKVGVTFNPSYAKRQRPRANFTDYMRTPSFMPVKHNAYTASITGEDEGSYAFGRHFKLDTLYVPADYVATTAEDPDPGDAIIKPNPWGTSNNSPVYIRENEQYYSHYYRLLTNTTVSLKIFEGLEFKTSNGVYVNYTVNERYSNYGSRREGQSNEGVYSNSLYIDLLSENTLNYDFRKGSHQVNALIGATFQKTDTKTAYMAGTSFPTDYVQTLNAATSFTLDETGTYRESTALVSYLARVNYAYRDKYLLSVASRADGSSLFGPDNKWGWFPSASVGWRVSEESFLANIEPVYMLKLRASVGITGNNDIENYAYQNTLSAANYQLGASASTPTAGLAPDGGILGNKSIGWEQTIEYNYGVDLSLFKGRIDGTFNYYYKITDQLLLQQEVNGYTGYSQYWNNIGKVRNKGTELELTGHVINNKKLKWNVSANISANDNVLLELGGESQIIKQGERSEQYIAKVGEPSIQYYGYKMIGIWASQEEIDNNPHASNDAPGGIRVADLNGDGEIDSDDRTTLGNPFPDYTWGAATTLKYAGFDLSLQFEGVQGVEVFNGDGYYSETRRYNENYNIDRWIDEDHPGTKPFERNGRDWQYTDYMIEDASYWCLRNVILGYRIPAKAMEKLNVKMVRLYVSAQNLLYIMNPDFRGINPEARSTSSYYSDPLIDGYQRGAFPLSRTYTVGVNINF